MMGPHVAVQRCFLAVLSVTVYTPVGSEAEVQTLVLSARPILGEALVAVPALEILFPGVRALVPLQVSLDLEGARAYFAHVGPVVLVNHLRRQKIN